MQHRSEIDGLRALAVVPVILFHGGIHVLPGGFVGVDIFFVISGYLITSIIVSDLDGGRFSLVRFYERRARRILPALFFVMLCCIPFAWMWMLPSELKDFSRSLLSVLVFASNFFFLRTNDYFSQAAELQPLLHTWSLAVEEQFYLLFPLLLVSLWRSGPARTLTVFSILAIASLGLAEWGSRAFAHANFYLLPTRAWELLAGAICALLLRRRPSPSNSVLADAVCGLGFGLIVYAMLVFNASTPTPSLATAVPVAGTCLLILFCSGRSLVGSVLSLRPIVFVGLISYSAYLWHQPIFAFARLRLGREPSPDVMLALSGLALLLAGLTWWFIEQPWRRQGHTRRSGLRTVYAVVAALVFVSAGGYVFDGFKGRFSTAALAYEAVEKTHIRRRGDGECLLVRNQIDLKHCVVGRAGVPPTIAVFGDSYAATLMTELDTALQLIDKAAVQYTKLACPASRGLEIRANRCHEFTQSVQNEIIASAIEYVIVYSRWQWYASGVGFDNGKGGREDNGVIVRDDGRTLLGDGNHSNGIVDRYIGVVDALIAAGKTVILVHPSPEVGWHVPHMAARTAHFGEPLTAIDTPYDRFRQRNGEIESRFSELGRRQGRLVHIRPAETLCDAASNLCRATENGQLLYYDDDHLSDAGVRPIVAQIIKAISSDAAKPITLGPNRQGGG